MTSVVEWFHCTASMGIKEQLHLKNSFCWKSFLYLPLDILILDISFVKSKKMKKNTTDWYIYSEMWISRFSVGRFGWKIKIACINKWNDKSVVLMKYLNFLKLRNIVHFNHPFLYAYVIGMLASLKLQNFHNPKRKENNNNNT